MWRVSLFLLIFSVVFACKDKAKDENAIPIAGLISNYESELNQLPTDKLESIDEATKLFQKYSEFINTEERRDSLFMPYFAFYNHGRQILLSQDSITQINYGFRQHKQGDTIRLFPYDSPYLEREIIFFLSEPMQEFCHQQLSEFDEVSNFLSTAKNAVWWEKFNEKYPDFFLKEMTNYHYKNWHLNNLLSGTVAYAAFDTTGKINQEALESYKLIVENHPNTKTASIVNEYLKILEEGNFQKTDAVSEFLAGIR